MRVVPGVIVLCLLLPGPGAAHEGLHAEIEALTAALADSPDDHELRFRRAQRLRMHGQDQAALADLAQLPASFDGRAALERGLLHLAGKDYARAELELQVALADHAGPHAAAALARAQAGQGCPRQALEALETALGLRPDLEDFLLRGRLLLETGQHEAAVASFAEGIAALGPALLLRRGLIEAELAGGDALAALAHLDEDLARNADLPAWVLLQAEAFEAAGLPAQAEAARLGALATVDRQLQRRAIPLRRLQRAEILVALRRWNEADQELTRVAASAPRLPGIDALQAQLAGPRTSRKGNTR